MRTEDDLPRDRGVGRVVGVVVGHQPGHVLAVQVMLENERQLLRRVRLHQANARPAGSAPPEGHRKVPMLFPECAPKITTPDSAPSHHPPRRDRGTVPRPRQTVGGALADHDRYARGREIMEEVQGREGAASILEGLGALHPDLPGYVVEGGFADVYARPGLDLGHRQLVTVAALATLGGCERQSPCTCAAPSIWGSPWRSCSRHCSRSACTPVSPRALNAIRVLREVEAARS